MSQSLTQHNEMAGLLTKFSTTLFQVISPICSIRYHRLHHHLLYSYIIYILQVAVAKAGPSENVLISPFSVAAVLAMTHVGAKGNTANQLKDSLQLSQFTDEKIYEIFGNLIKNFRVITNSTQIKFMYFLRYMLLIQFLLSGR